MAKKFDSVLASPVGDFVRSPLGVRDAGGVGRAVYTIAFSTSLRDAQVFIEGETLFRLSLDDLTGSIADSRPPWWPAPDPALGQLWRGTDISGDSEVLWYAALNQEDFNRGIYTIDIFKLNSRFEILQSIRWHQPELGVGRAWLIRPFGDSLSLFGLAFVNRVQAVTVAFEEVYIVELDPRTMAVRRSSPDLFEGLTDEQRALQRFDAAGGHASAIWLSKVTLDLKPSIRRVEILEYRPSDFMLVRRTLAPGGLLPFPERRDNHGIGGDSESIWIATNSVSFDATISLTRVSELPRDFGDANRTIIQDEVIAPQENVGEFRSTLSIG